MSQKEINRTEWENPENWHGGYLGLYHSRLDSRLVVPKRTRVMGWTLNTGRPLGMALIVLALGGLVAAVTADLLNSR